MAVIMMLSSVAAIGASAADGYAAKNPITDNFNSYYEFVDENENTEIFGYTYDLLYDNSVYLDWEKINIRYNKMGFPVKSTKDSIALAQGNMNSYLKRVMNSYFLGDKLYTEEYAVDLVNFFGKLVDPGFEPVSKVFDTNTTPNEFDFFEIVAEKSKLGEVIQTNWIDAGVEFKTFLTTFGVDLKDIVNSDFQKGKPVAKALIQGAVNRLIAYGPLEYAYLILERFSSGYSSVLYEAATSLFSMKISQGKPSKYSATGRVDYSEEELRSVEGFLTYAFDGILDYDFFKFPGDRIAVASGRGEKLLYLMMYFAINYKYNDNAAFVDGLANKINNFLSRKNYVAGYSTEELNAIMDNVSNMTDMIFKGDIKLESIDMLSELTQTNLDATPDDIKTQITSWFSKLLRKIADYFDYLFKLFSGEIKYGESLLD